MAAFLSDEWLGALERAARDAGEVIDPEIDLVLEQIVTDDGGPEIAYHLIIGDGRIQVGRGRASSPTVTFITDRETAARVNRGLESAQTAFMTGRLRVSGDIQALLTHQQQIAALDDLFAVLRADTTY
ncbi:MAG: SCP2 sterol-binding domain-containing protein [Acidimicrobiales bacterium]